MKLKLYAIFIFVLFLNSAFGESSTHYYMLSEPMDVSSELGPVARQAHYWVETGAQAVKVGLVYHATGEPIAALGVMAWEFPKIIPSIPMQSAADLKIRDWYEKHKNLKKFESIPGLNKVTVISSTDIIFKGLLAQNMKSRGVVFIETSIPLTENDIPDWQEKWGRPIAISDPTQAKLNFKLNVKNNTSPIEWNPSLKEVLDGKGIPDEIVDQWKKEIKEDAAVSENGKIKAWFTKHFSHSKAGDLSIEAFLINENGQVSPLGIIAKDGGVKSILGQTWGSKMMKILRRNSDNVIPISSHSVSSSKNCAELFSKIPKK